MAISALILQWEGPIGFREGDAGRFLANFWSSVLRRAAFRPNRSECPDWLGMCAKWGGGHASAVSEFLNHLLGNTRWKRPSTAPGT